MSKIKKSYRIEQKTADKLAEIAKTEGITATGVLERAIRAYGQVSGNGHTDNLAIKALSDELEKLHGQYDAKDRQIEQLGEALSDAQATAKAAQALHAATSQVKALESSEQKKSRLQRLREAWRG